MSQRPTFAPTFRPAPLTEQAAAITDECRRAHENLPKLTMHPDRLRARLHEHKSLLFTALVLERFEQEGRLPPDLAAALRNEGRDA